MEIMALRKVTGPEGTKMAFAQLHTLPPLGQQRKELLPQTLPLQPLDPPQGPGHTQGRVLHLHREYGSSNNSS